MKIFIAIAGLGLTLLGLFSGALYLLLPFVHNGSEALEMNIIVAGLASLGLGLGVALAYQATSSLLGRPSGTFRPPPAWPLAIALVAIALCGQLVLALSADWLITLAFPPFHVLAAVLPAMAVLAFAGRRLATSSWREVTWQVACGTLISPPFAFLLEAISIVLLAFIALLLVSLTPEGVAWLQELISNLQAPGGTEGPAELQRMLLSPPFLAVAAVGFVVIAPMVEELLKGLSVVTLSYRLRGKADAFLWGLASGAGFSFVESLFSGAISLPEWGLIMLLRVGATLMHCLTSGTMGLGWYYALVAHRPWRLIGAYMASVCLHAFWNAVALGLIIATSPIVAPPGYGFAIGGFSLIVSTAVFAALLLSRLTEGVRD